MISSCSIAPAPGGPVGVGRGDARSSAAAGIVVTEISTPTRAPDLADVSESMPAVPAKKATMKENLLGLEMKEVSAFSVS